MGLSTDLFHYFSDNIESRLHPADRELIEYWNDSNRISENTHHALVERIRARMPGYFYDRKKSLIISQAIQDSDFNFDHGTLIWDDISKNNLNLSEKSCGYDKPVLIIHGRQDPVGESVPILLSEYYPNSDLVFIEKVGHYSWIEQPESVREAIRDFY